MVGFSVAARSCATDGLPMGLACTEVSAVCMSFFFLVSGSIVRTKSGAATAFVKFRLTLYLVFDGLPIRYR